MTAATDTFEAQILALLFPSNQAWISLHPADPGETGASSAEITGGAYVRKQATMTTTGSTSTLSQTITWDGMPAVTVGGVGIWDSQTNGKMLVHLALAQSKTLAAGDSLVISAGNLSVSAD